MKNREKEPFQLDGDPLWYKDAVFYEVHVRAFYDSDGDGIGDFRALAQKLTTCATSESRPSGFCRFTLPL